MPLITSSVRRGLHSSTYRGQLLTAVAPYIFIHTWNPTDPCFDWKRPCFGELKPQNRGQTGSRYLYRKKKLHSSRTRGPPSFPLPAGPFNPGAGCHRRTRQVEQATKNWRFLGPGRRSIRNPIWGGRKAQRLHVNEFQGEITRCFKLREGEEMWVLCERNAQQATTLFLLGGSGTVEVVGSSREWKILVCLCVFLGDFFTDWVYTLG